MCGRFVAKSPPDEIARYFDVGVLGEKLLEPNFNVAPSTDVYAVLESGGVRRLDTLHWGLIPFWAKDMKVGYRMINAREEGLADKNAYKRAFRSHRCIIPADGFYEWTPVPGQKKKQPWFIHRRDDEPLAFAGLWEVWKPKDAEGNYTGDEVHSCTIITTTANETMEPIHDRMPVILAPKAWDTWLDPEIDDLKLLGKLLVPAPPTLLTMHPVSTEVNNARNQGEHLVEAVDPNESAEPDPAP